MKYKIFFIIGASGSGKTALLEHLEKAVPDSCALLYFDSIGVPAFAEMEKEYGSIEEWQRGKTFEWIEKLVEKDLIKSHIIFDAQVRLSFISEACNMYGARYEVLLLDCFDDERKRRLVARGHHKLVDENMMHWAAFLRKECQKRNYKIINNTHLTFAQTFQLFLNWLEYQLSPRIEVSVEVVARLIKVQFPEYERLAIREVKPNRWDNRTFRLGNEMSIRLPSAERYAAKVPIEHEWLPRLSPYLSLPIPKPIAKGEPSAEYSWNWSIYGWIPGKTLETCHVDDVGLDSLAVGLAHFLKELQAIESAGGPQPGTHNFFRGESPVVYDAETRSSIDNLHGYVDSQLATRVWEKAIYSRWSKKPVWIHGDFSLGNILIQEERLVGVIDFGGLAVGDPSCDLCLAWTFFKGSSRKVFKSVLALDEETWDRGRGWALWKALITLESIKDKSCQRACESIRLIEEILKDYEES